MKNNHPNIKFIKFLPKKNKGKIISSTLVKQAIEKGNCQETKELLGRFYTIKGKVTEGKNLGEKLGFPTANIIPSPNIVIPKDGIYASIVEYNNKKYYGATSIGKRPTFEKNGQRIIETLPEFLKSNKDLCSLGCNNALDNAIITAPEKRDPKVLKTLDVLLQRLNK